nr:probable DNA primase large subunit [Ipomoea batatas]
MRRSRLGIAVRGEKSALRAFASLPSTADCTTAGCLDLQVLRFDFDYCDNTEAFTGEEQTPMEIVRSERKPSVSNGIISTLPIYRSAPPLEEFLMDYPEEGKPDEMAELVSDLWKANMRHPQPSEVVNKDIISHFVLRLVYCRTPCYFVYRYQRETSDVQSVKDKLSQVARCIGQPLSRAEAIFYKVPFEEVPELVAGRRVFIQKGNAYIATHQLVSLVINQFRSNLSKALALTNRKWTSMIREQEKDRLTPIVEALSTSYLGPDYSQPPEYTEISLKDIDQVAKTSFPLCMRHLFEKGVGLKLDDALAFWKAEFSRKVGAEKFDKEYAYGIRHNYGKEGKRVVISFSEFALM